jgi:pimeloyl-ACP methyl ester carboxylesterase
VRGILQDSLHWKKLSQQANGLEAAREKMDALMDSVSLLRFPIPISKNNAIIVAGDADAIVPPQSVQHLHNHWQGSELRWVSGGHVRSIFGKTGIFRQAIRDSFARSMENKRL